MKAKKLAAIGFGIILLSSFSCKKKEPKLTQGAGVSGSKNEPGWVARCAGAFPDAGKRAFYGCGAVSGIENEALRLQTADARARGDLEKAIEAYVAGFFKDFMKSPAVSGKKDMTVLEESQLVETLSREITEITLYGVQITDRWTGPDQTLYSLARVSFDILAQAMSKQIAERSGEFKMEANEAMEELDRQLEKRRESGLYRD